MYCDFNDEYVDSCEGCEEYSCEHRPHNKTASDIVKESDLAKEIRAKFAIILGSDTEAIDKMMGSVVDSLSCVYGKIVSDKASEFLKTAFSDKLQEAVEKHIARLLEEKLSVSVISETAGKYMTTKIEEVILNKTTAFFASNYDSRDKRDKIVNDTIDNIIGKVVNQKVQDAFDEIKSEAIDKFNKEAMKRMMQGMARELGADKRLLTLLSGE